MISRRTLLSLSALGGLGSALGLNRSAAAATTIQDSPAQTKVRAEFVPVHTLNGWTLPAKWRDGAKEFHLVAEEVEHEFAPGCKAKC